MKKKGFERAKISFLSIVMVLFVILEIDVIINYKDNYKYFAVMAFLIILAAYLLVNALLKKSYQDQAEREAQLDDIVTSDKASYLLMRKSFQELDEKLNQFEDKVNPLPKIMDRNEQRVAQVLTRSMEEQKKVAKITISRSKENTVALMNSNDELSKIIHQFEDRLSRIENFVKGQKQEDYSSDIKEIEFKQQEILSAMKEMELSMKNEILEAVNKISSIQPKVVVAAPTAVPSRNDTQLPAHSGINDDMISEQDQNSVNEMPSIRKQPANPSSFTKAENQTLKALDQNPDVIPENIKAAKPKTAVEASELLIESEIPEAAITPEEPETAIEPDELEAYLTPEEPESAIEPDELEAYLTPEAPESAIEPDELEAYLTPEAPETAIEADELEAYLTPEAPETAIEADELETYLTTDAPETDIEMDELEAYLTTEVPEKPETAIELDELESNVTTDALETVIEPDELQSNLTTEAPETAIEPDKLQSNLTTDSPETGISSDGQGELTNSILNNLSMGTANSGSEDEIANNKEDNKQTSASIFKSIPDTMASAAEVDSLDPKIIQSKDVSIEEKKEENPAPAAITKVVSEPAPAAVVSKPAPAAPDLSNPNKVMSPDDIAALLASLGNDTSKNENAETPPVMNEIPAGADSITNQKSEENASSELYLDGLLGSKSVSKETQEIELKKSDSVKAKPVKTIEVKSKPKKEPQADMSDPGKMMSPDDIAALIASVGSENEKTAEKPKEVSLNTTATANTVTAKNSTPKKTMASPKPLVPEKSDPNKIMTPDEIAALIANL